MDFKNLYGNPRTGFEISFASLWNRIQTLLIFFFYPQSYIHVFRVESIWNIEIESMPQKHTVVENDSIEELFCTNSQKYDHQLPKIDFSFSKSRQNSLDSFQNLTSDFEIVKVDWWFARTEYVLVQRSSKTRFLFFSMK